MKKLLVLLGVVFLLVACGGNEETKSKTEDVKAATNKEETNEPTQAELDAKLKEEATPLDFIAANGDEVAEGTRVTITGEVTIVMSEGVGGEFSVTTEDNDGFGVYTVKNLSMKEVVKGDTVTVYGIYDGRDVLGIPSIAVTVIE